MTDPLTPSSPATAMAPVPAGVARSRQLAVGSLLALIALCLAWELWLAPLRPGGSWLVLKVLPLTIPLAGLLKNRMYTYRWLSLLVWLYAAEGAVRMTSDPSGLSALLAGIELLLCVVLFVACTWHIRTRLRAAGKEAIAADAARRAAEAGYAADPVPPPKTP
jgi:uncharacterized membrane protein